MRPTQAAFNLPIEFSLYELINSRSTQNIFLETTPVLARWCRVIEQRIVDEAIPANVYVSFQKLSRFARVLSRY